MKNAIEQYTAARTAYFAAQTKERAALEAFRKLPRGYDERNLETRKAASAAHNTAAMAEQRAARIKDAAAYIAEQKIKAAAAPIVTAVLKKYAGKPAGPKTRDKAAAEIAAALGIGYAYFDGHSWCNQCSRVCIRLNEYGNDVTPEIYTRGTEYMIDESNRFVAVEIPAPNVENLPADLEAWADEFDRAADELEAAKNAFEAAAAHARRVNLGNAALRNYRITDR